MEHKASLYADDLLLFISTPSVSLHFALDLFSQFGQISVCKLNLTKRELFRLGSKTNVRFYYCLLLFLILLLVCQSFMRSVWYFYHNFANRPDWVIMKLHSDNNISLLVVRPVSLTESKEIEA